MSVKNMIIYKVYQIVDISLKRRTRMRGRNIGGGERCGKEDEG